MGVRKQSLQKLPDWWSIEKYADMESLTLTEWYVEIAARRAIQQRQKIVRAQNPVVEKALADIEKKFGVTKKNSKTDDWEAIKSYGLVTKSNREGRFLELSFLLEKMEIGSHSTTNIRHMTLESLANLMIELDNSKAYKASLQAIKENNRSDFFMDLLMDEIGLRSLNKALISLDLSVSDATLKKEFEVFLKKTRALYGRKVILRATEKTLLRYASCRVLPAIDLDIWQIETGVRLTQARIADAISSDMPSGFTGDDYRITVLKHVRHALSNEFLGELWTLVQIES